MRCEVDQARRPLRLYGPSCGALANVTAGLLAAPRRPSHSARAFTALTASLAAPCEWGHQLRCHHMPSPCIRAMVEKGTRDRHVGRCPAAIQKAKVCVRDDQAPGDNYHEGPSAGGCVGASPLCVPCAHGTLGGATFSLRRQILAPFGTRSGQNRDRQTNLRQIRQVSGLTTRI